MAERGNYFRSTKPISSTSFKPRPKPQRTSSASTDKGCVVCYREVKYHSVGICEHSVCYECSARMRVLLEQNECPICRQSLDHVLFTHGVKPYSEAKEKMRMYIFLPKYGIYLEDDIIKTAFDKLLEHKCILCMDQPNFSDFNSLREHIQRRHELFSCDLCVEHIKHFTNERKFYTRADLGYHKRKGDRNDTSHRGHPICEFCDKRFFDQDELYKHLRKDHYFCHFCDGDGFNHYYNTYDNLRIHYRKEHFLCEEEHCAQEKFTSVFRSEIDLKAHLASAHSRLLGKHGTKQARTLDIEFALPKRSENERGRFGRPLGGNRDRGDRRGRERDTEAFTSEEEAFLRESQVVQVPTIHPKIDLAIDFPTLDSGGAVGPTPISINGSSIAQKVALSSGMNVGRSRVGVAPIWNAKTKQEDDFPALEGSTTPATNPPPGLLLQNKSFMSKITGTTGSGIRKPINNQSGMSREDDFPILVGSSKKSGPSTKVWSGSGPKGKTKYPLEQDQSYKTHPKSKNVAPCPEFNETNSKFDQDFNYVPLSMSKAPKNTTRTVLNGIQSEQPFEPELIKEFESEVSKNPTKEKKKSQNSENSMALAAAALFNGGTAPTKIRKPKIITPPSIEIIEDFPSLPIPMAPKKAPSPPRKSQKSTVPPPARRISPPPGFQLKKTNDNSPSQ